MAFDIPSFHRRAVETRSDEHVDDMRSLLVDTLEDAGEYPEIDDLGNVVVSRGDEDGTHILLNTHIDTVRRTALRAATEPPRPTRLSTALAVTGTAISSVAAEPATRKGRSRRSSMRSSP